MSDPVVEAYKKDVDRTLLRENLRKTPEERIRDLMKLQRFAEELRRARRWATGILTAKGPQRPDDRGSSQIDCTKGGCTLVLKRVGVWSAAKLSGALYGSMGLIFGVIFGLMSLLGAGLAGIAATAEGADPMAGLFGVLFGLGAIIFLPLFYGTLGLLVGAVSAALFNLFAGLVGGLEVELE